MNKIEKTSGREIARTFCGEIIKIRERPEEKVSLKDQQ